jgi:sugar phosphate isomerase/epimerase
MRADQIALQLYTVREETSRDMVGTLQKLAAVGYRAFEFAGFGNSDVREVRAALDDLGVRATSAHFGLDTFENSLSKVIDDMRTLGAEYAVVAWIPPECREDAAGIHRMADEFNGWAEKLRGEGLGFAYHNHDFEFAPLDGTNIFDIIVGKTEPNLVKLELDVYWVRFADREPLEVIRSNAGRIPLLHIKDMAPNRDIEVVGEGVTSWKEILEAGAGAGTEWYIIEHDLPKDALSDVERALRYLESQAK